MSVAQPVPNVPPLLSIEEAAAQLGLRPASLRSDRSHHAYRLLPVDAYVKIGTAVRVRSDRLGEHVRNCTMPAPEPTPYRLPVTRKRGAR